MLKRLIPVLFFWTSCSLSDCETMVMDRVLNPGRNVQAVWVLTDCGATTTPSGSIRIIESRDTTDVGMPANRIASAYAITRLYWKTSDTLLVSHPNTDDHDRKTSYILSKSVGQIVIVYQ